jgi:hypothetical protein
MNTIKVKRIPSMSEPDGWEEIFKNEQTGDEYRLLSGGGAWPGKTPGFAVVVAVDRKDNPKLKIPHLRVLAEVEEADPMKLIQQCIKLRDDCFVHPWYGNPNTPMEEFLHQINRELREFQKPDFYLIPPPHINDPKNFDYYATTIKNCMRKDTDGNRVLLIEGCEKLRAYLENFPEDGHLKGTAEEYPAVAALGYVITSLGLYQPWQRVPEEPFDWVALDPEAGY